MQLKNKSLLYKSFLSSNPSSLNQEERKIPQIYKYFKKHSLQLQFVSVLYSENE